MKRHELPEVTPPRLYHFTARHLAPRLSAEGVFGAVAHLHPERPALVVEPGWVWLTSDPCPAAQAWARPGALISYSRTTALFRVRVPRSRRAHLHRWIDVRGRWRLPVGFDDPPHDPEAWWLYEGRIKASWLEPVDLGAP